MADIASSFQATDNAAMPLAPRRESALSWLCTAAAVIGVMAWLCAVRWYPASRAGVERLWKAGLLGLVQRYPAACLLVCQTLALGLSTEWVRERAETSTPAIALILLLWLVIMVVLRFACVVFDQKPTTLAETRRLARKRWPERYFAARMRTSIDAYFLREIINSAVTMIPAWLILIHANFLPEMNYIFFAVAILSSEARHEQIDHTNIHDHFFRCPRGATPADRLVFRLMDFYMKYVFSLLILRIPLFFATQHVYIHHVENNGVADTQSTLPYDRCSFIDFCRYAGAYALDYTTANRTIAYLLRRRRYRALRRVFRGMILWYGVLAAFFLVQPATVLFFFCFKFGVLVAAAGGAYIWHIFADPDDPQNVFRNSIDTVVSDNHGAFGGLLHIEHHHRPGTHWSELAAAASRGSRDDETHGALRWYDDTGNLYSWRVILRALWSDRIEALEPLFASYNKAIPNKETLCEVLRARTRPAVAYSPSPGLARLDRWLGGVAARYLIDAPFPPSDYRARLPRRRSRAVAAESN